MGLLVAIELRTLGVDALTTVHEKRALVGTGTVRELSYSSMITNEIEEPVFFAF